MSTSAWVPVQDDAQGWTPVQNTKRQVVPQETLDALRAQNQKNDEDFGARDENPEATAIARNIAQPLTPIMPREPQTPIMALGSSDVAGGVRRGAAHTLLGAVTPVSRLINKVPLVGKYLAPESGIQNMSDTSNALTRTETPGEKAGYLAEQIGEMMLPGAGEEAVGAKIGELAPMAAKYLIPAVNVGRQALESGLVNKLQGGDFSTGAGAGLIGGTVAEGLKSIAPSIAESALNIRKLDRAYGKTPGRAILDETTGWLPSSVAESARNKLSILNPELDNAVQRSSLPASLAPARNEVGNAMHLADIENTRTIHGQLSPMDSHLKVRFADESGIPEEVSPMDLLNLKRGFGKEFIHRWNPETMEGVKGTAAKTYHALDNELDRVVPEAKGLNQRISSLIPVAKRAESTELNAPTVQRIMQRVAAHSGALAGSLTGGYYGYERGGVPGMIGGTVVGAALPEMIVNPTGGMIAARLANKALSPVNAVKGGLLQLDRKKSAKEKD